jgi:hypothetical protein
MPRPCTICVHLERHRIEADLRAGIAYRGVARRHSVSEHALWRHRVNHVSRDNAPALAIATNVMALLNAAEAAPNWNVNIFTIREARRCLEELLNMLNLTAPSSRQM